MRNISTLSPYIFQIYYSDFSCLQNNFSNFYPHLIYGSFCFLNITENRFFNTISGKGIFDANAIVLEHNITFQIYNNTFQSLQNILNGPVLILNFCLKFF